MTLHGQRYVDDKNQDLAHFIEHTLHCLDFEEAHEFYAAFTLDLKLKKRRPKDAALLNCNDRYYLLTATFQRGDVVNQWLFERCREVEADPDDHLDLWARDHYKALVLDEPVPTPSGWSRHGDLRPGDWVYGPDGKPTRVVARTPVFTDADCFRVSFDDGYSVIASGEHLWTVERKTRKRIPMAYNTPGPKRQYRETVTLTTRDLAQHDHAKDNRIAVPVSAPLDMPPAMLPVDPYVLGAWLGDGHNAAGRITCGDPEVFQEIARRGYRLSPETRHLVRTVYGIWPLLNDMGLASNKGIPMPYLRGSIEQRRDLLRGLMDTDGHCHTDGTAVFVNKHEPLARDVFDLAAGLGLKPRIARYGGDGSVFHVTFRAYECEKPFTIPRKLARCKPGIPKRRRFIVSVEPVETVPVSCIQVARPDGLYLIGKQHVTTHNSTVITYSGAIQEVLRDPNITIGIFSHTKQISAKFLKQIMSELEQNEWLKECHDDCLWKDPAKEAPLWGLQYGIIVKRQNNPKESTIEAHGLVKGQPTSKHFALRIYDDVVTRESVTNPEQVRSTTEAWELSDNLGGGPQRKWHIGTRYSFADTWGIILERKLLKPRLFPATHNGRLDGIPVFLPKAVWENKKRIQASQVAAQMLQNPLAGTEQLFQPGWLRGYMIRPKVMNIYIMGDPSRGVGAKSDRTALSVVGLDSMGNKYLVDGFRHRMSLSQRWENLKNLYLKWSAAPGIQLVRVGYERYGLQSDQEYFSERMNLEGFSFPIDEVAWTREGDQSKKSRVERLQPDIQHGNLLLPALVWQPGVPMNLWRINEEKGHPELRPLVGDTKSMAEAKRAGEEWRIARPLVRKDEENKLYDLTRSFMEEAIFFPFGTHDDLLDATSRIYDMTPIPPIGTESDEAIARLVEEFPDA